MIEFDLDVRSGVATYAGLAFLAALAVAVAACGQPPASGARSGGGTSSVVGWGADAAGQLGDGSTASSDVPVTVKLPKGTKATKLGAGSVGAYSLALVHHA